MVVLQQPRASLLERVLAAVSRGRFGDDSELDAPVLLLDDPDLEEGDHVEAEVRETDVDPLVVPTGEVAVEDGGPA